MRWRSGEVYRFDAVVSAIGYHYPSFNAFSDSIIIHNKPDPSYNSPELSADLRAKLPGSRQPERIWFTGISANFGVPVVNGLFIGVKSVNDIVQKIAKLQTSRPEKVDAAGNKRMRKLRTVFRAGSGGAVVQGHTGT